MYSTPRRRSEASIALMMCLRERPPMFGPDVIGKKTFVAMTSSSRLPNSRSARPVTSSLAPSEYMSAVSKKLIPASMARLKNGRAASSSRIHGRHFDDPYVMHPRQTRETLRPVLPRFVNFMRESYAPPRSPSRAPRLLATAFCGPHSLSASASSRDLHDRHPDYLIAQAAAAAARGEHPEIDAEARCVRDGSAESFRAEIQGDARAGHIKYGGLGPARDDDGPLRARRLRARRLEDVALRLVRFRRADARRDHRTPLAFHLGPELAPALDDDRATGRLPEQMRRDVLQHQYQRLEARAAGERATERAGEDDRRQHAEAVEPPPAGTADVDDVADSGPSRPPHLARPRTNRHRPRSHPRFRPRRAIDLRPPHTNARDRRRETIDRREAAPSAANRRGERGERDSRPVRSRADVRRGVAPPQRTIRRKEIRRPDDRIAEAHAVEEERTDLDRGDDRDEALPRSGHTRRRREVGAGDDIARHHRR